MLDVGFGETGNCVGIQVGDCPDETLGKELGNPSSAEGLPVMDPGFNVKKAEGTDTLDGVCVVKTVGAMLEKAIDGDGVVGLPVFILGFSLDDGK